MRANLHSFGAMHELFSSTLFHRDRFEPLSVSHAARLVLTGCVLERMCKQDYGAKAYDEGCEADALGRPKT